jgi:general secretion pathway protein E
VSQAQVNPIVDFTFASALRSFLRHDPDIIMVGEIRDGETAAIATQAAITGHLVLTTLHTGSAAGAISRLFNMGVEPYLLSSSLLGVLGQRLVRMICSHCKEPVTERTDNVPELGLPPGQEIQLHRGRGCVSCRFTGYIGRTGIFEFLPLTERIRRHVMRGSPEARIHRAAAREGMTTLRTCGLSKVREGLTTMEEVLRVSR